MDLNPELASARTVKLRQVDGLPDTQLKSMVLDQHGYAGADDGSFDVGSGVALIVSVKSLFPGNHQVQLCQHIGDDIGIGIFTDGYTRSGMRDENRDAAVGHIRAHDNLLHQRGDIQKLASSLRGYFQPFHADMITKAGCLKPRKSSTAAFAGIIPTDGTQGGYRADHQSPEREDRQTWNRFGQQSRQ